MTRLFTDPAAFAAEANANANTGAKPNTSANTKSIALIVRAVLPVIQR